jgi:hypothetical protein
MVGGADKELEKTNGFMLVYGHYIYGISLS